MLILKVRRCCASVVRLLKLYQSHIGNLGWLAVDKFSRLIYAVFVGAYVARYLGPGRYGIIAIAMSTISFFQAFSILGLDPVIVSSFSRDKDNEPTVLGTAFLLRIAAAILAYLALGCLAFSSIVFRTWQQNSLVLLLGLIVFCSPFDTFDLLLQSRHMAWKTTISKIFSMMAGAIAKVMLVISGAGLFSFAAVIAAETLLSSIALAAFSGTKLVFAYSFNSSILKDLSKKAIPLVLSSLLVLTYMRIGVLYLGASKGPVEAGLYSIGAGLSEVWYIFPSVVAAAIAPSMARKANRSMDEFFKAFRGTSLLILGLSIAAVLFNLIWGFHIVTILYGKAYQGASVVYAIHSISFVPVSLGSMQSIWLVNTGRFRLPIWQSISGAGLALFLTAYLVPMYGAIGAAVALVISQYFQCILVPAVLETKLLRSQLGLRVH